MSRPKPVSPNRLLLLPLPLVAALLVGIFLAFVASQVRPVFLDGAELRAKTGLPVLGVVTLVLTDLDRHRERMSLYRFVGASGGLVGIFALGLIAMLVMARNG